jgi:hypothetical protein
MSTKDDKIKQEMKKKQQKQKEMVDDKKKAKKEISTKKKSMLKEEKILTESKNAYDKIEGLRRKFLKDIIGSKKKKLSLQEESKEDLAGAFIQRFETKLESFEDKYVEDDLSTSLFVVLLTLLSRDDSFPNVVQNVLAKIKDLEIGAIIKTKKGSITNFYDTSTVLELIKAVQKIPKVRDLYNKKKYVDEEGNELKLVQRFGTLEEAEESEKELLEKVYQDSIRLNNLWRDKVKEEITDDKAYKKVPMTQDEIKEELESEKERYEFLNEMKDYNNSDEIIEELENIYIFGDLTYKNPNNDLFVELLKIMVLKDNFDIINNTLSNYDKNPNTILSLLEELRKSQVFLSRYDSVRKAIEGEFKTLREKYGSSEDLVNLKKKEFLNLQDGIKLEEVVVVKPYLDQDENKYFKDEIERAEKLREKTKLIEVKIPEELKETTFYPLKQEPKPKPQLLKDDKKYLDDDEDVLQTYYFDPNVVLSKIPIKKRDQLLRDSIFFIKKYFDKESSKELVNDLYKENKDKSLDNFIKKIGKLIILVDDKYLKNVAKLLNKRLEQQYYNISDMINLSYKELLQDVYSNPLNTNFNDLERLITLNIDKFSNIFLSCLRFNYTRDGYTDISDCISKKSDEQLVDNNISNILNLEGIEQCNFAYKNKKVFENYLKALDDYKKVDQNDVSESLTLLSQLQKELNNIRPFLNNIIYYKDEDDNQLYCFDYKDLEERFINKNYKNPYTNRDFSEQFIKDFNIAAVIEKTDLSHKKDKKDKKDKEQDFKDTDFSRSIFSKLNSIELSLMEKLPKQDTCEYYNKYIFNKDDSLEKIMKKNKDDLDRMKEYCAPIIETEIKQEEIVHPKSPSKSSSDVYLQSVGSLPSLTDGKKSKKASLPLLSQVIQPSKPSVTEPSKPSVIQSTKPSVIQPSKPSVTEPSVIQPSKSDQELSEAERKKRDKRKKIEELSKQLTENL